MEMENRTALIIDTCGEQAGIMLYHEGKTFCYLSEKDGRRHTPVILKAIDDLLQKAGIGPNAIREIAAVVGPGSFTGIRVGVATANAFGAANGIKRIAITSLEPFESEGDCVVILDCKHGNYYALKSLGGKREYLNLSGDEPKAFGVPVIEAKGVNFEGLMRVYLKKSASGAYTDALQPFYLKESGAERNVK